MAITKKEYLALSQATFTNPDKILYPEQGITKHELGEYYYAIHEWILPHVVKRPLTFVRCPQGRHKNCFYQKHVVDALPGIFSIDIQEKVAIKPYPYIKNLQGILALVQIGVLEIHLWNCHIDLIEKPDMFILDLDPAEDVVWDRMIKTAHLLREALLKLKLISFVKTTGGKGLHIVVPIKRDYPWDEVKNFTKEFVLNIVTRYPNDYTGTMSKAKRTGKIFIDYFRNQRGATSIAPYSTRARKNAPVATPLNWDELTTNIKPDFFNIKNIPERLATLRHDPWEEFFSLKQKLKI